MSSLREATWIFLVSAIGCLLAGRWAIRGLSRAQWVAPVRYEDCPPLQAYQQTKPQTPTMGGVFVLAIGVLIAVLAGGLRDAHGWLVLTAVVGLGGVGLIDDCLKFRGANAVGLRSMPKLWVALALGGAIGWILAHDTIRPMWLTVPWTQQRLAMGWAWVPLAMCVVAGCAHAVNLTDGMDGLAAGCVAIALVVLGLWALTGDAHDHAAVPWCASLAGACVGFLWFNSFPASVYLGDVGAMGLGAALGVVSLISRSALWLVLVGGIFVAEALSVMLQVASYKWRNKRRIFRVAPLHHHFHLGGMSEPKLIVRFWIVGLLLATLGLSVRELP